MLVITNELPKWKQRIVNFLRPHLKGWGLTTIEDAEKEAKARLHHQLVAHEKQRYALRDEYECEITALSRHMDKVLSIRQDPSTRCGCRDLLHYTLVLDPVYFDGFYMGNDRMRDYLEHLLRRAASELVRHGGIKRPFTY